MLVGVIKNARRLILDLCVVVGIIFAGAAVLGPFSTKADLVVQFLLQGAVLTFALFGVMLLRADRIRALVLLAALVIQVSVLRPGFGTFDAAADPPRDVRLLFANVLGANDRYEEVISTILAEDADIVVLAEVLHGWPQALHRLRRDYPHGVDCLSGYQCDVVILSRLPMTESPLSRQAQARGYVAIGEVETEAGPLLVSGTHFRRPIPLGNLRTQMGQARYVADHLPKSDLPTVLAGDLNSVTWGRVVNRIEQNTGLKALHGLEGTWPSQLIWPLRLPIDHVFISDKIQLLERRVIDMPGSDHKSIVIDLAIL